MLQIYDIFIKKAHKNELFVLFQNHHRENDGLTEFFSLEYGYNAYIFESYAYDNLTFGRCDFHHNISDSVEWLQ